MNYMFETQVLASVYRTLNEYFSLLTAENNWYDNNNYKDMYYQYIMQIIKIVKSKDKTIVNVKISYFAT